MKSQIKSLLLPFYFGSIAERERLLVEQQLLLDSEVLVDFLDLKRSFEAAEALPATPSAQLWTNLKRHPRLRKKIMWSLSFGAGVAVAAVILFIFFFKTPSSIDAGKNKNVGSEILFDSSSELSTSSNVL